VFQPATHRLYYTVCFPVIVDPFTASMTCINTRKDLEIAKLNKTFFKEAQKHLYFMYLWLDFRCEVCILVYIKIIIMNKKQRDEDEKKCLQLFHKWFGDRFGKMYAPKKKMEKIDLVTIDNDETTIVWELKHSDRIGVNDFKNVGAMIDVSKFKHLQKLTTKNDMVMYCRFYTDGYAIWHINSLEDNEYKHSTDYVRKRITRSNNTSTKKDSILLDFNAVVAIHQEEPKFETVQDRLQEFYKLIK